MSKKIEEMYLVLKWTDILGYLDVDQINDITDCCLSIREGRAANGKLENKYIVCNQDELYADKVLNVILEGEERKSWEQMDTIPLRSSPSYWPYQNPDSEDTAR